MTNQTQNTAMRISELRKEIPILRKTLVKAQKASRKVQPDRDKHHAKQQEVCRTKGWVAAVCLTMPESTYYPSVNLANARDALKKAQRELETLHNATKE